MKRGSFYKFQSDFIFVMVVTLFIGYIMLFASTLKIVIPQLSFYYETLLNKCVEVWGAFSSVETIILVAAVTAILFAVLRIVLALVRILAGILNTHRFIESLEIIEDNDEIVVFNSSKKSSFVYGYIKPKIYVSTSLIRTLNKQELTAVILHEEAHIKYFHNLKKIVAYFVLDCVPLLGERDSLKNGFNSINEIASDEYCYKIIGSRRPLVSAISTLLRRSSGSDALFISNFTIKVSRIDTLVAENYKFQHKYIAHLMLLLMILFSLLIVVQPATVSAGVNQRQELLYGACREVQENERFQTDQFESKPQSESR